jgi:hypothetical protein
MSAIADLLADPATPDAAIAREAASAEGADLDVMVRDESRLLRHPAIVAALFGNPKAPMALVDRAVAICVRGGVRVPQIPAFDEIAAAAAVTAAGPAAARDGDAAPAAPAGFDQVLAETQRLAVEDAEALSSRGGAPHAGESPPGAPARGKRAVIDFGKLKLFEKIRLATLGNAFCRQTLLRDSNRLVAMAAIRSPGITDAEVVRAAGNRAVSEDVIRYIANNKDHVKLYPVKVSLVGNPKCPLALSMRLLAFLHAEDLKTLARSKNVPSALATAARKLSATRSAP